MADLADGGLVSGLLGCRTSAELDAYLAARSSEFGDNVDGRLASIVALARQRGDDQAVIDVEHRRAALRGDLPSGRSDVLRGDLIDLAAYRPIALAYDILDAPSWETALDLAAGQSALLGDDLETALASVETSARQDGDDDTARSAQRHRAVLARARASGVDAAVQEATARPELREPKDRRAWLRVVTRLASADVDEIASILAEYPALLSSDADALLREVSAVMLQHEQHLLDLLALCVEERRLMLDRARRLGIDSASRARSGADRQARVAELIELADRAMARFDESGDRRALDEAIGARLEALGEQYRSQSIDLSLLNNVGSSLVRRHQTTGDLIDLRLAITAYHFALQSGLQSAPEDIPREKVATLMSNAASALGLWSNATGDRSVLRDVVALSEQVAYLCDRPTAARADALVRLAGGLLAMYEDDGDLDRIERAVALCREALWLPVDDSDTSLTHQVRLVVALVYRYRRTGEDDGLDAAVRDVLAAVRAPAANNQNTVRHASTLAPILTEGFVATGRLGLADAAIELLDIALDRLDSGAPRADLLSDLAVVLLRRYQSTGEGRDLDRAVEMSKSAARTVDRGDRRAGTVLMELGAVLRWQYKRSGDPADLDQAVDALDEATGLEGPTQLTVLANLGFTLNDRYLGVRNIADLERSIVLLTQVVAQTQRTDSHYLGRVNGLAGGLRLHAMRVAHHPGATEEDQKRARTDLDRAVTLLEDAVALSPDRHHDLALAWSTLGLALWNRFSRDHDVRDIERATQLIRSAIEATAPTSPYQQQLLWNYLWVAHTRVSHHRAVAGAGAGDLNWPTTERHARLLQRCRAGDSHAALDELDAELTLQASPGARSAPSDQTDSAQDEGTEGLPESLLLLQTDSQLRITMPATLISLFSQLHEEQQRHGAGTDASAAIWCAVLAHPALSEVDEQGQRWILLKAAAGLFIAYNREQRLSTLDSLIAAYRRLLALLPEDHPWHPVILIDAARCQAMRHSHTADTHDLDAAFDALAGLAEKIETGSARWVTCLTYLGDLLKLHPATGNRTESYLRRARLVDRLLSDLPSSADGVRWTGVRMALIGAYAESDEPSHRLDDLSRAAELAERVHAAAVRDGDAALADRARRFVELIRGWIAQEQAVTEERIEVRLEDLLSSAGDRSDPVVATERVRRLRLLARQVPADPDPDTWFVVRAALIADLMHNVSGERVDNLEEAIAVAHEALPVAQRHSRADITTFIYTALGELYLARVRGSRADNVERAIEYQCHRVDCVDPGSSDWVRGQIQVAYALTDRVYGDHRANVEEALERCAQALAVADSIADRDVWAAAQYMLGGVYTHRVAGSRAENLERAIEAYTAALEVFTLEASKERWANTHHNLALAYTSRLHGDREDNLRRAIDHHQQELRYFTREEWPADWALAHHGIGNAYSQSYRPDPQQSMHAAIAAFETALTVLTRADYPADWARTQANLGLVLIDADHLGGRARDPERALRCFRSALEVLDGEASLYDRALVLMNTVGPLAMLAHRHRGDRARAVEHLDEAMAHATEAAGIFSRDTHPLDWARTQTALAQCGLSYAQLGLDQHLPASTTALESALDMFRTNGLLLETRGTAAALTSMYATLGRWDRAVAAYQVGAEAAEVLYQASLLRESRGVALQHGRPLVEAGVTALVHTNDLDGAVVAVERARARWLGEALARDRVDLARLAQEHPELVAAYHDAAAQVRLVEAVERRISATADPPGTGDARTHLAEQANAAHATLAEVTTRIRRRVGYDRFLALPDIDDIGAAVSPGEPLVYLIPTESGCILLLVHRPPSGEIVVTADWAEELTKQRIDQLLFGDGETNESYLGKQITGARDFGPALARVLDELGRHLVGRLADQLRDLGVSGAVLIPGGHLALLPLHAAPYLRDGRPTSLLDEFDVRYGPSAWVYADARATAAKSPTNSAVLAGIADPTGDLSYARVELEDIAGFFTQAAPAVCYGAQATKAALLDGLRGANYVHLACHGYYDLADPLESHLRLAGDERLTLRELLDAQAFQDARLVVASACQTAVAEFMHLPDESVGLSAGFLRSGAAAVIGTLWPVDDLSTALLMVRFYELHLGAAVIGDEPGPMPLARALRAAQRWLAQVTAAELAEYFAARLPAELAAAGAIRFGFERPDDTPFRDPYFWAPFVLIGA